MIFNHDPPMCVDCKDCGGSSRCGMGCSALVSNNVEGYPVCTTIGQPSSTVIDVHDRKSPHTGVIVKMTHTGSKRNCSLSVSVICNSNGVQGPQTLETVGFCDYSTELKHPLGCAKIISSHGNGLGWFGTFMIIILCLFGAYLLAGAVYRYYFLHIRGIDVIPNLEFWASLPHRIQSFFLSLVRRFRGPSQGYRSSYSPVNFWAVPSHITVTTNLWTRYVHIIKTLRASHQIHVRAVPCMMKVIRYDFWYSSERYLPDSLILAQVSRILCRSIYTLLDCFVLIRVFYN